MREVIEKGTFFAALAAVTIAFLWLLRPFWAAILWACIMTLFFFPLQRYLRQRFGLERNFAAAITLLLGTIIVILPAVALVFAFVREGIQLYQWVQDNELNPEQLLQMLEQFEGAMPILPDLVQRMGIDTANLRAYLSEVALDFGEIIGQEALRFARNTASFTLRLFLMLYLIFFLLRDGEKLLQWIREGLPLEASHNQLLLNKFVEVTRATVRGNLIVALIQGGLGGLIFFILGIPAAVLWAALMALLSLLPAVGAFLVWGPVAIYLYTTGEWVQATILVAYGMIVIGLADYVLRPILVGRGTKLPDYMVLFSTLGGLALMGLNGFVVGPMIAVLFVSFWDIFSRDIHPVDSA